HTLDGLRTGGIHIRTINDSLVPTRYDGLVIEGNTIYNIENVGISTSHEETVADYPGSEAWNKRRITGVESRGNTLYNISKNAVIVRLSGGGIVEHKVGYNT